LIGTSRGTVSAAAASIALGASAVSGLVLTSSVTDAAKRIDLMTSAPVKKFIEVEGGSNPTGNPCGATHWHGYINYEPEMVKIITNWIKHPIKDAK